MTSESQPLLPTTQGQRIYYAFTAKSVVYVVSALLFLVVVRETTMTPVGKMGQIHVNSLSEPFESVAFSGYRQEPHIDFWQYEGTRVKFVAKENANTEISWAVITNCENAKDKIQITSKVSDNVLVITANYPSVRPHCPPYNVKWWTEVNVTLPTALTLTDFRFTDLIGRASLNWNGSNVEKVFSVLTSRDVGVHSEIRTSEEIILSTISGDISVTQPLVAPKVQLSTKSGDVRSHEIIEGTLRFDASTASGKLELLGQSLTSPVITLSTSSGDISVLSVVQSRQTIFVDSASGRVRLLGHINGPNEFQISTSSGDVHVTSFDAGSVNVKTYSGAFELGLATSHLKYNSTVAGSFAVSTSSGIV